MIGQLVLGTVIIIVSVVFHVAGLIVSLRLLQRIESRAEQWRDEVRIALVLVLAVLFVVAIHTIEAWSWAAVYFSLGEFAKFENALYFSVVTATTLGYGDITVSEQWRILASFEAMGGLILFGASTAFLFAMTRRLIEPKISSLKK